jgi:phosphoribosylamine--glycine ligase
MKVLVVGGGGREHALAWAIRESPLVRDLVVAPGNPGTASLGRSVPVAADDVAGIVTLADAERPDLVVVGPEAPLCLGLADALRTRGVSVYGPSKDAARLEGSKVFAKEFMRRRGIPTADFAIVDSAEGARAALSGRRSPVVVKADGLAAGKGVVVCDSGDDALPHALAMLSGSAFGDAGRRIVIEDRLEGEEASFLVVASGKSFVALATSQDHKRLGDGDRGPNTGGMGAYAPAPIVSEEVRARAIAEVVEPALEGLAREGMPFVGTLYAGLMIDGGRPRVLEFNVRFGDPETEALVLLHGGDLFAAMLAAAKGDLGGMRLDPRAAAAATVVLASAGYPASSDKGRAIDGVDRAGRREGVVVFHAGTASVDGRLVTAGGRVLAVSAAGKDLRQAIDRAYGAVSDVRFEGMQLRRDIGARALGR